MFLALFGEQAFLIDRDKKSAKFLSEPSVLSTGSGNRTHKGLLPADFESTASTNFAIPASTLNEDTK